MNLVRIRSARGATDKRDLVAEPAVLRGLDGAIYDPGGPMGKLFFNIFATFAELASNLIRARSREGMAIAKAKGRPRGEVPKLSERQRGAFRCMSDTAAARVRDIPEACPVSNPKNQPRPRSAGSAPHGTREILPVTDQTHSVECLGSGRAVTGARAAIRVATPNEICRLREIARAAYAPYVPAIGREPPPMHQDLAADLDRGRLWVTGTPAAGFVVACADGADWHVENLAVHPEAAGRGLGQALLAFAEAEGCRRGYRRVTLYTNAAMAGPLALYPSLGYRRVGQRREAGLDRVFFVKEV
ncbi:MAG: GNAT family N-acetyltransferase [Paracoccaceae bacterium]